MSIDISETANGLKAAGWDCAIKDCEKHIKKLQAAIRVFKKKKASGEPWPGDENGERPGNPSPHSGVAM